LTNKDKTGKSAQDEFINKVNVDETDSNSAIRYDIATLDEVLQQEDGFLTVKVAVTRPGVFAYRKADGTIQHELKHPEDIYSKKTMDSVKAKPVTDGHPNEPVTRNNIRSLIKGMTHTDTNVEDGLITVHETIFDEGLITEVLKGDKREVSIGFETQLIPEQGEYNGQRYDYRQSGILVNHIAHVTQGRAGEEVGVRGDSAYQVIEDNTIKNETSKDYHKQDNNNGGKFMEKVEIDGKEVEVQPEVKAKLDKLYEDLKEIEETKKRIDELKSQLEEQDELKEKIDSLNSEIEAKNGQIDALEGKLNEAQKADESDVEKYTKDEVDQMIKERINLYDTASKYIKDFDDTDKSNRDIKVEVIQTVDEDFKGDEKSDEYINARFDATIALIDKKGFKSVGANNLKATSKNDSKVEELRQKRISLKK